MNIYGRTGIPQLPTKEGRGGYLLVMFDVIYPTAPGVHLNGGALRRHDIDRVVLSIGLLGARVAEKAAVRI